MSEAILKLHFDVDGSDFSTAGEASAKTKQTLKKLGLPPDIIRKVVISMYEGEINMVIHANGGTADVEIKPEQIIIWLEDSGKGIPDINQAMREGFSTATDEVRQLGFGAGMGLPNIKKYTDEFEVESVVGVGTKLKMVIHNK